MERGCVDTTSRRTDGHSRWKRPTAHHLRLAATRCARGLTRRNPAHVNSASPVAWSTVVAPRSRCVAVVHGRCVVRVFSAVMRTATTASLLAPTLTNRPPCDIADTHRIPLPQSHLTPPSTLSSSHCALLLPLPLPACELFPSRVGQVASTWTARCWLVTRVCCCEWVWPIGQRCRKMQPNRRRCRR